MSRDIPPPSSTRSAVPGAAEQRFRQALCRLLADVDEKNRRRIAGLLALEQGFGGVQRVALLTGLSRTTVLLGRRELESGELGARDRVRAPGGGRKPAGKAPASSPRSRP
jgi:hypothetical protein